MLRPQVIRCARKIREGFSEDTLNQVALETRFSKRLRKLTPLRAAWSLIVALGAGQAKTLAQILRIFTELTDQRMEYKPFHDRLSSPGFPLFFRTLLDRSMEVFVGRVFRCKDPHLEHFKDILIQDGTSFALHPGLKKHFPGRFTANYPAAVEVHCTYSLFRGQCTTAAVAPDKQGERDFLPAPETLRGHLLLLDAGYLGYSYFEEVRAAGGHVICRGKMPLNPLILGVYRGIHDPSRVVGQRIRAVSLPRNTIDLLVEGTDSKNKKYPLRLVMKYSPQEKAHILLFTTLPPSEMPAERVASLYRLRWQVELFFKECKSHSSLQCFQTADPRIAEGLIWASLLAVLFRRFLLHSAFQGTGNRFSSLIAARMAWSFLKDLGRCVLLQARSLTTVLQVILDRLRSLAARTNLQRTDSWTLLGIIPKTSYA